MSNTDLKVAIIKSGWKSYELAQQLGWHPTKISQIVIGAHNPTEEEKNQLADELGRPVADLFPEPQPQAFV